MPTTSYSNSSICGLAEPSPSLVPSQKLSSIHFNPNLNCALQFHLFFTFRKHISHGFILIFNIYLKCKNDVNKRGNVIKIRVEGSGLILYYNHSFRSYNKFSQENTDYFAKYRLQVCLVVWKN